MTNYFVLVLLGLLATNVYSQNLVPNPSFEDYSDCPDSHSQIAKAINWFTPYGTSDYMNSCFGSNGYAGVPHNTFGSQYPHSGNAYAGIIERTVGLDGTPFYPSEFIGVQLDSSLVPGVKYFVKFYVSLADLTNYTSEAIGLRFFVDQPLWPTVLENPNLPAHVNDMDGTFITDKTNWTLISGSFVADSAYNYLIIGSFDPTFSPANYQYIPGGTPTGSGANYQYCYFYIDDVCVSSDSLECSFEVNLNIEEFNMEEKFVIKIYDTLGRETEDKPNTLLIYIYSDGTSEKVFRVE